MANELESEREIIRWPKDEVRKHRAKCPVCLKKGIGYAYHPHAFNVRDRTRVVCQYCGRRWKLKG